MASKTREAFRDQVVTFYSVGKGNEGVQDGGETGQSQLRAVFRLISSPGKVLCRNASTELADWTPEKENPGADACLTARHGGRTWHMAQTRLSRLGWRFVTMASARTGPLISLTNIPNTLAALINLAIFGSVIVGSEISRRISDRVLAMAELVRETGAEPGKRHLPVRGRDELGYLATTLNRMSEELAVSVRRLQETTAEKERLAAEMELARQVQRKSLPADPPCCTTARCATSNRPACRWRSPRTVITASTGSNRHPAMLSYSTPTV
jgi:methyl-accepting chemotaxis protein